MRTGPSGEVRALLGIRSVPSPNDRQTIAPQKRRRVYVSISGRWFNAGRPLAGDLSFRFTACSEFNRKKQGFIPPATQRITRINRSESSFLDIRVDKAKSTLQTHIKNLWEGL